VIWILITIVAATATGIYAERRWPEGAGLGSRRGLLLILYFVLPPIVFFNLVHLEVDFAAGAGIGLGLVAAALLGTLAWVIAVPLMKLPAPTAGAVICCAILANTSYLGYPMVYALMGGDALTEAVLFDVVVSYSTLMLGAFAVGAAFGTKAGEGFRERLKSFFLRNPLIYAAVLGLLAPSWMAPDLAVEISRILVLLPLVVGFFAVGAILTEEQRAGLIKLPPRLHRPVAAVVVLRLLVAAAGGTFAALRADVAADRGAGFVLPAGGDADRAQLDDRRPRLRIGTEDHGRVDRLYDHDRRARRRRLGDPHLTTFREWASTYGFKVRA